MRFVPFEALETPRLILRDIRMEDIQEYYEDLFSDGDVCRWLTFDPHQDIGESLQSIQEVLEGYERGGMYRWAITRKGEDGLIGVIGLTGLEDGRCSLDCLLARKYWNQGYGTEAVKAVLDFAFEKLEAEVIRADHMRENAASGAVMRKAGMRHTGTHQAQYTKHGQNHDALVYEISRPRKALTAAEYQKLAMVTLNPALDSRAMLTNAVMGLCGEAGEAIDLVKKHLYHGHDLNREALVAELGDIAWYLAEAAQSLDLSLEDILRANISKLQKRYPGGFSTDRSLRRKDQ